MSVHINGLILFVVYNTVALDTVYWQDNAPAHDPPDTSMQSYNQYVCLLSDSDDGDDSVAVQQAIADSLHDQRLLCLSCCADNSVQPILLVTFDTWLCFVVFVCQ